jgi:hypothetical protein
LDAVEPPEVFDAPVARRGRQRPDRHVADSSQYNPGLGSIIVFELDPDGTQLHVLKYPLTIRE